MFTFYFFTYYLKLYCEGKQFSWFLPFKKLLHTLPAYVQDKLDLTMPLFLILIPEFYQFRYPLVL